MSGNSSASKPSASARSSAPSAQHGSPSASARSSAPSATAPRTRRSDAHDFAARTLHYVFVLVASMASTVWAQLPIEAVADAHSRMQHNNEYWRIVAYVLCIAGVYAVLGVAFSMLLASYHMVLPVVLISRVDPPLARIVAFACAAYTHPVQVCCAVTGYYCIPIMLHGYEPAPFDDLCEPGNAVLRWCCKWLCVIARQCCGALQCCYTQLVPGATRVFQVCVRHWKSAVLVALCAAGVSCIGDVDALHHRTYLGRDGYEHHAHAVYADANLTALSGQQHLLLAHVQQLEELLYEARQHLTDSVTCSDDELICM